MFCCLHVICLKVIIFNLFLVSTSICFQSFVYLFCFNCFELPIMYEKKLESFQHWQKNSSCALSQPNRKQDDQKTSWQKVKKKWLTNFLDKLDITYVTPGRKDHRYVGKVDGKSQYVQKHILMWTLNDLLNIAKGNSMIKNETPFEFSFGKKIKLHQLYEYIKSNREYLYNREIPQSSYLC